MTEHEKNLVSDKRARELKQVGEELEVSLTSLEIDMLKEDADSEEEASELIDAELNRKRQEMAIQEAKKLINQETPSRFLNQRPSSGVAGAQAEIHMRQTFALLLGRRGGTKPITGLYDFAAKVKGVLSSYRKGCPYAAKLLLEIEEDLKQTNEFYVLKEAEMKKLVNSASRIKMDIFTSRSPADVDVVFASPYAYHALELMLRFDDVIRLLMPYYQVRLVSPDIFYPTVQELGRHLRRILGLCDGYYYVGRESVQNKDDTYLAAVNSFGELDQRIIKGELLPYMVSIPQSFVH